MKKILISLLGIFVLLYIVAISSCVNDVKNIKNSFDIVFLQGSDSKELMNFAADLKTTYPALSVEEILTDEDSLNEAAKFWNIKQEEMEEYKIKTRENATAKISLKASIKDLGSEKGFENFISQDMDKYNSLKFKQYAGSVPAVFFAPEISMRCASPTQSIKRLFNKLLFN